MPNPRKRSPSPRQTGEDPNRCWSRMGVWRDRTCPELDTVLLKLPHLSFLRANPFRQNTTRGVHERVDGSFSTCGCEEYQKSTHVFAFRIESEWLALPMSAVIEITERNHTYDAPQKQSSSTRHYRGERRAPYSGIPIRAFRT